MAAADPAYVNLLRCPNGGLVEPPQPKTGFGYFVVVLLKSVAKEEHRARDAEDYSSPVTSPTTRRGLEADPKPNLPHQSFSLSYGSALPTYLTYIVLATRGSAP
ncbi:hypothetical protein MPTK1_8g17120 [Marchantia polymorpha subsp. ruderalis]|nr:hypothetical protein MARPO_0030s0044 [Marchantia polymorpha]BBN20183.1 hypothetical protein Mp_8g17120 [Marchantia polymorpha subsp. ruderalis]|eukprot:PTQ42299.1 hypothetical protein MARPO_0030s0044 [Marchantia polymorpha]